MLSSPFQQPSRRQNSLALQIQQAREASDDALLSRLISQWVHRYGFNGAAELDLTWPDQSSSAGVFSNPVLESGTAPGSDVLPVSEDELSVETDCSAEDEMFVEEDLPAEDEVLVEDDVPADDNVVTGDKVFADANELQKSLAAGPVPAPPISTPRSLRRWLPRREDDAFPKAS